MKDCFATFTSGCQEIIAKRLQSFANSQLAVKEIQDGVVIFESSLNTNQLSELRFFTNVFAMVADLGQQPSIEDAAQAAAKTDMAVLPRGASFTIHVRVASQPVGIESLSLLNQAVANAIGGRQDSFKPDISLLLWLRADGRALWGWQLPSAGFRRRTIEPGELRPELAHIMGLLAGLTQKHAVLDPFAGYGGIVRECLQGFHCQEVIAVEHNEHLLPHLKSIPRLIAKHGDAARLPHIITHSIDRVITDPPWGNYEQASEENLRHVYFASLQQMHRVLRTKGCVVMLTGVDFLPELAAQVGLEVEKQYNVLVSGQKAWLYKLRKIG